jgi:sugar lactone lactonase YvrE
MKNLRFVVTLLATGLMLFQARASAQVVTTLAGSGAVGNVDGTGAMASFWNPRGVAVDQSGNIFVADTNNSRIRKITPDGGVTTFVDFTHGYPNAPTSVAVDGSGNVWEVDPVGDGIDGADLTEWSPDGKSIAIPVALESLAADDGPAAIAADKFGNVYLADGFLGVLKFDAKGNQTVLAKDLKGAMGIAVDGTGNVYVADWGTNRVRRITPDGSMTTLAGSGAPGNTDGTGTAASFRGPAGVAVGPSGNVYVADQGNHTIRKITPAGIVTTLAGSGRPGSADGTGIAASFNSPTGVTIDQAGSLYVADSGNNKIRKIALEGESLPAFELLDLWVTPEDETGYLSVTSSGIGLGVLDNSGNRMRERSYGPYDQWIPVAAAGSLDGLDRILWRNVDGRWDAWLAGPDGVLGSFVFPAEPGLTPVDIAGGQAGVTHVLASGAGNAVLWTVDAQGGRAGTVSLGSYPGWTATAISDGADGLTRLLWTSADGRSGLSLVSSSGILQTTRYGAENGWTSADAAAGGDGLTRILRVNSDGHAGLWIVDGSGTLVAIGPTYAVPPGFAAQRLCAGQDGSARVLLRGSARAKIWLLSPDGVLQGSIDLAGPAPPTGLAGDWTGTFDSADFVDCDSGTPAQASFTLDGESIVGTLNAPNDCGFMGARFIGTLQGNIVSGKVGGDRFINAVATGNLSGTNLEITIVNGWGLIPGGQMHFHR